MQLFQKCQDVSMTSNFYIRTTGLFYPVVLQEFGEAFCWRKQRHWQADHQHLNQELQQKLKDMILSLNRSGDVCLLPSMQLDLSWNTSAPSAGCSSSRQTPPWWMRHCWHSGSRFCRILQLPLLDLLLQHQPDLNPVLKRQREVSQNNWKNWTGPVKLISISHQK